MAQTTTKRKPPAKAATTRTRTPAATTRKRAPSARRPASAVDATKDLSREVVDSLEQGQREAIKAVRKFVDSIDHALPALAHGDGPTRRQEIVDSALKMADELVQTQYDFIRKVIDSAGRSLTKSDGAK
ncbi:MAG TPA: hypothetical protein VF781_02885 [Solirubrobacteraceae bacterium]